MLRVPRIRIPKHCFFLYEDPLFMNEGMEANMEPAILFRAWGLVPSVPNIP